MRLNNNWFSFVLLLVIRTHPSSHVNSKSVSNKWINFKTDAAVLNGGILRSQLATTNSGEQSQQEDNNRVGGVSFVPLISVIANYLPKFLKRLKTQQITSVRSLSWLLTDEVVCTTNHLGRFRDPDNQCQFFECAMNLRNIRNCSYTSPSSSDNNNYYNSDNHNNNNNNYNDMDDEEYYNNHIKPPLAQAIRFKNKMEINEKDDASSTSLPVMYKVDKCVSLILHQCSPGHAYSNRLQKCLPYNNMPECPD